MRENETELSENGREFNIRILGYIWILGWRVAGRCPVVRGEQRLGNLFFKTRARSKASRRNTPATIPQLQKPRLSSRVFFPAPRVLFTEPRLPAHLVGLGDVGIYQLYWDMLGYVGIHWDICGYLDIFGYWDILGYWAILGYWDIFGYIWIYWDVGIEWDAGYIWIFGYISIFLIHWDILGYEFVH